MCLIGSPKQEDFEDLDGLYSTDDLENCHNNDSFDNQSLEESEADPTDKGPKSEEGEVEEIKGKEKESPQENHGVREDAEGSWETDSEGEESRWSDDDDLRALLKGKVPKLGAQIDPNNSSAFLYTVS